MSVKFADLRGHPIRVGEGSPAIGRTLGEFDLPGRYGVTVPALRRGGSMSTLPAGTTRLEEGGVVIVYATNADVQPVMGLFERKEKRRSNRRLVESS